jgi:hypothetical protein
MVLGHDIYVVDGSLQKTKGETCVKSIKILTKEELAKSYDLKGQIYDLISSGNNIFLDMECTSVNVEQAEVVKIIAIKKVEDKIVCFNTTFFNLKFIAFNSFPQYCFLKKIFIIFKN